MSRRHSAVWIFSHSHYHNGRRSNFSGPVRFLLRYFLPKSTYVVLNEQPMPGSDNLVPLLEIYKNGKLLVKKQFFPSLERLWKPKTPNPSRTYFRLKLRDVASSLYFTAIILKHNRRFDYFIGVECLNALFGCLLRFLGLGKTVIYYLFDFAVNRYPSSRVNAIYLWLDKQAAYQSDATWNISRAIEKARIEMGYDRNKLSRQITVPYGIDYRTTQTPPPIDSGVRLAYAGAMVRSNGVMLLPEIVKLLLPQWPGFKLLVLGGGKLAGPFRAKVGELGIGHNVDFIGYLPQEKTWEMLTTCHIGLAPYEPFETTKMYGDVIKIKTYLSAGLPVVTTSIPPISREIINHRMGAVTEFKAERFAEAVRQILLDDRTYRNFRQNALNFMRDQTWENILTRALAETSPAGE